MINGYTQLLQDNLGISGDDVQAVKDSFSAILAEKVDAYREARCLVPTARGCIEKFRLIDLGNLASSSQVLHRICRRAFI